MNREPSFDLGYDRQVAPQLTCECADRGCKAHTGKADCFETGYTILYRIDMHDETGTVMCEACTDDAFSSGLFVEHD